MHGIQGKNGHPRTICAQRAELTFEMIEQNFGYATVIRFSIPGEAMRMGDTLVVLAGEEIRFHGMINSVDPHGRAVASDRRGSSIPFPIL